MMTLRGRLVLIVLAVVIAALVGVLVAQQLRAAPAVEPRTPYQAVLLSNGQAYFGRIDRLDSPYRIILNRDHILFIEPVGPDSTVSKLIEDLKKQ